MKSMQTLTHSLLTNTNVVIEHERELEFNAPHDFKVTAVNDIDNILATINFQKGPVKEVGVNGIGTTDVLAIVLTTLEHFQRSEFSCRENAIAITKIEEAMLWLNKRTADRQRRGVEGYSVK